MNAPTARLRLRVAPGAGRSAIVGRYGEAWKVRVAAAPERGRANEAVVGLLAETLGLSRPDIRLVAGATTRDKIVELSGLTLEEIERRLQEVEGEESSSTRRPAGGKESE